MLQLFGYISAILSIVMVVPYIKDIFALKTKPERASWFIWMVLGVIAFFSQFAKGATESLWLTGGQTAAVLIVFVLALRYGVGGLNKRDIKALIAAGMGLMLWYFTKEAVYALLIVILVDGIGTFLTVVKAYKYPESETLSTFAISLIAAIFGSFAVGSLNVVLLAYPLYLVLANALIVGSILLGKKKHFSGI